MSTPVRVLWLTKGLGRGGAEQLLVNLARSLDPALVRLDVGYVLPHKDALTSELAAAGVRVHCLSRTGIRNSWPLELGRLLRCQRYDVVHTHSPLVAAVARVIPAGSSALVHTEHNVWSRYRRPTRWANAVTIHRNKLVLAVSQGVADSISNRWHRRETQVEVLIHGLVPAAFTAEADARRRAREQLSLSKQAFVIGSVGNLTAKKDQDTLIAAVAKLRAEHGDAHLVLVGGGPREAHLRAMVAELDLAEWVTFTGVRDDVPELLPAFDVFSLSSRYEGLSIALLEAMAAGVPPVVTAVGGMTEVITDRHDGLLVPAGDPAALCAALADLHDDALRTALGEAARERATCFGIGPAAQTLTEHYRRLSHLPAERAVG